MADNETKVKFALKLAAAARVVVENHTKGTTTREKRLRVEVTPADWAEMEHYARALGDVEEG